MFVEMQECGLKAAFLGDDGEALFVLNYSQPHPYLASKGLGVFAAQNSQGRRVSSRADWPRSHLFTFEALAEAQELLKASPEGLAEGLRAAVVRLGDGGSEKVDFPFRLEFNASSIFRGAVSPLFVASKFQRQCAKARSRRMRAVRGGYSSLDSSSKTFSAIALLALGEVCPAGSAARVVIRRTPTQRWKSSLRR